MMHPKFTRQLLSPNCSNRSMIGTIRPNQSLRFWVGVSTWQKDRRLDRGGSPSAHGALNGKVGGAFTSSATQHGGQETTLFSLITNLLHFGMIIVGLPYSFQGQMLVDEITGSSPYGASTIAGGDGSRQPSENELAAARYQGELVARTAKKLFG
jgi:NAD(P)H dehydrogenase (quinone)